MKKSGFAFLFFFTIITLPAAGASIVDPDNISLSVALPSKMTAQNFIFARVGIKIAGVENMIYSQVKEIPF